MDLIIILRSDEKRSFIPISNEIEELEAAIKKLKSGKSPGRDNIHQEFVIHQSAKTTAWLCSFITSCFRRSKLPKTWRRATVVALPKPNKPAHDPKSYRPISLLCVPFKILERLIHSRIDPVVDPQLPREQAGFRRGRSTVDQVILLTQDIEDSFQHNEKAWVVFLDLTAAYDTVWHRGLHLKLLRIIPDRHMVGFIMEMLSNRSFVVFFFRVLHTMFSHFRAHAFAPSVTVARMLAVQASSSRRQERRWAIVCGSPQSQSTDWASSR